VSRICLFTCANGIPTAPAALSNGRGDTDVAGVRGPGTDEGIPAMKGDRVEIVIDAGGSTRTYEIEATRAGRRVDVTHGRGVVEVTETTRGGTAVRTARFMSGRVLALVEHPAPRPVLPDDAAVSELRRSA
jgi:hypothetical protein